jgi:hypothetical protein
LERFSAPIHPFAHTTLESNVFGLIFNKSNLNCIFNKFKANIKYTFIAFLLGLLFKKPFDYFIHMIFAGSIAYFFSLLLTIVFVLIVSFIISNLKGLEYNPLIAILTGIFS